MGDPSENRESSSSFSSSPWESSIGPSTEKRLFRRPAAFRAVLPPLGCKMDLRLRVRTLGTPSSSEEDEYRTCREGGVSGKWRSTWAATLPLRVFLSLGPSVCGVWDFLFFELSLFSDVAAFEALLVPKTLASSLLYSSYSKVRPRYL